MDQISDYEATTGPGIEEYGALTLASEEMRSARAPKHLVSARRSRYEHLRVGGDRADWNGPSPDSSGGIAGKFEYVACPALLGELVDVLARPKISRLLPPGAAERFIADVRGRGPARGRSRRIASPQS
jgi:hypothetical protein